MSDIIGTMIGQYQIVELAQDTDLYLIYKGFQPNMNRYVMVKVLKSQDPTAAQIFTQQNELLAQVQHPNILSVYESGQAEGRVYRVLRYAEGGVLQNHMMQYYDPHKATGLISGIVAGLDKIHAQGFIHGNLQPGNIYLSEAEQPLLTDFGLSKASVVPVTAFMSPEQVQGGIVDKRTDVYSLGILLYVMLTGEIPPTGVVVSPRSKRPDLPETLEKIIFKASAQNPDARFQSAQEFQTALATALQPVVPVQTSVPQPPTYQPASPSPAPRKRTNWVASLLGIVLVVIICGGIGLIFVWWNNSDGDPVDVEPTAPPAEIIPTQEAPEPTQPEEPIQPPEEPRPTTPPEGGEATQLPAPCSSIGFAGGFFILGGVLMIRKRPKGIDESEEQ